ncbi:MAG TPA: hypothetical protein VIM11_07055 [Tepidisphaeraceae bacterium]
MTETNSPNQGPATPTGFDLIEKLLGEFRDTGKSATLEKWNAEFAARLDAFKTANTNPKLLKDAGQIEKAFGSAARLLQAIKPAGGAGSKQT